MDGDSLLYQRHGFYRTDGESVLFYLDAKILRAGEDPAFLSDYAGKSEAHRARKPDLYARLQ